MILNKLISYFKNSVLDTIFTKTSTDNIVDKKTGFCIDTIINKIERISYITGKLTTPIDIKEDFNFNDYIDPALIKIYLVSNIVYLQGNLYFSKNIQQNKEITIGKVNNNIPDTEVQFYLYSVNNQAFSRITIKNDGNITVYAYDNELTNSTPLSLSGLTYVNSQTVKLL